MHLIKLLKTWGFGILLGIFASVFLYEKGGATIVTGLHYLSLVPQSQNPFVSIFFKNSLASLTIVFLGLLLCVLELGIYKNVSSPTYSFLERLTEPLYGVLSLLFPIFDDMRPFFRSCYFYLVFVPYFSMLVNGAVFGFLLGHYYIGEMATDYLVGLFPHALVEIPAMFASAVLALLILDGVRNQIISGEVPGLENALKVEVKRAVLPAALVQVLLFIAAFLESCT